MAHGWFQAASGKVSVPVIVHTALEIAAGMSDLHAHGIVHGDLTGRQMACRRGCLQDVCINLSCALVCSLFDSRLTIVRAAVGVPR